MCRKGKRKIALLLSVVIVLGVSGCGVKKNTASKIDDISNMEVMTENTMPITNEKIKLSFWTANNSQGYKKSYSDMKAFQELEKRTGIEIEFMHPSGAIEEQLSIMLASNDYPDIMFSGWGNRADQLLKDGVCYRLNEYIDKFAPNLKAKFEEHPGLKEDISLVDGDIIVMPRIFSGTEEEVAKFSSYNGYFIRQDWLDKVNMEAPETIEDWYNVLKAFKSSDSNGNGEKDEIPFTTIKGLFSHAFSSAFGISRYGFFMNPETGKITHAVLEPGMKEYLITMNKWYEEGLINTNFLSSSTQELDSLVLNDQAGAFFIDNNNSVPKYLSANPDIKLSAVPFPKTKDGKIYHPSIGVNVNRGGGAIITKSCKHVIEAVRYLDYLFSDEGSDLMNWGIEGESYTVDKDNNKVFTDLIVNNPDGKAPTVALCDYMTITGFVGAMQPGVTEALAINTPDHIKKITETSVNFGCAADRGLMLPGLKFTVEEKEKKNSKEVDMNSYIDEMIGKFIIGVEPLENYDTFVGNVKKMGLLDVLEVYQSALDRK